MCLIKVWSEIVLSDVSCPWRVAFASLSSESEPLNVSRSGFLLCGVPFQGLTFCSFSFTRPYPFEEIFYLVLLPPFPPPIRALLLPLLPTCSLQRSGPPLESPPEVMCSTLLFPCDASLLFRVNSFPLFLLGGQRSQNRAPPCCLRFSCHLRKTQHLIPFFFRVMYTPGRFSKAFLGTQRALPFR